MDLGTGLSLSLWEWVQLSVSCVHLRWWSWWWHQGWNWGRGNWLRLIARAIRATLTANTHHHSQFFNTFYTLYFTRPVASLVGCSRVSGQWPNGSSSISLAALTITANYFPCRVIFLSQAEAASELQSVSAGRHYFNIYSPHLSVFLSLFPLTLFSLPPFLLLYHRNSRPHRIWLHCTRQFIGHKSWRLYLPISLWVL